MPLFLTPLLQVNYFLHIPPPPQLERKSKSTVLEASFGPCALHLDFPNVFPIQSATVQQVVFFYSWAIVPLGYVALR